MLVGIGVAFAAFLVYWLSDRMFDAGRGDLFYLADSFLHGHPWIDVKLGPNDIIAFGGHLYVPFAPFPAIVLMPLVAVIGPVTADQWEPGIDAGLAAFVVLLAWWVSGRIGVARLRDRLAMAVLLGFSTQVWWITTRGGVWHTGHLIAMILTLFLLAEMFGQRRPVLMGLLVGAGVPDPGARGVRRAGAGVVAAACGPGRIGPARAPRLAGSTAVARVGTAGARGGTRGAVLLLVQRHPVRDPLESGYALAALPPWLEALREQGLFSLSHVSMNVDYLFLKVPVRIPEFPYFRPDGLGMSVFITSPGLLLAPWRRWRDRRTWWLLLAAVLVLIPTLLYYGGGWLQYGYRYFLDSIPFVWALVAMGISRRGAMWWWGWLLIGWGVLVGLGGVYWAYHLK